ncbi:MAG: efflux transporter outer membrane subunit [Kiritimatiellae bacterium]|nr:efflux transporter outer membrane subunit [Kiritimatiellia bacterium]
MSWLRHVLATSFAALLCAGCSTLVPPLVTVGPDYKKPTTAIEQGALPDAGFVTDEHTDSGELAVARRGQDPRKAITIADLDAWWRHFNDPLLTELIERATTNNLSYAIAQERLEQARWAYSGSFGSLLPALGVGGSVAQNEWHKDTSTAKAGGRDIHRNSYHGGFDMTWEIDIFGGQRRANEAAKAAMEAEFYSVDAAYVSLTAEIGAQYVTLRTTQQRIKTARANLKLQNETYEILKARLDSGIGDELAVSQAKYNVDRTRSAIPPLQARAEELMNALAILAGDMPGTWQARLAQMPDRDWLLEPQKLAEIPLDAIRSRPDVRAAERLLAAQVASVGVSKSMLFPKFYLNGSLGLDSVKATDFLHRSALYSSIGPSFSWPIFRGGAVYADYKAAESKMDEAAMNYELAIQTALGEVRNSYSAYTHTYHTFKSLTGAVEAAGAAVDISKDLYKNGLADFNNVLDAQRSKLNLEDSLNIARGDISLDLIRLYKSLGGGLAQQ